MTFFKFNHSLMFSLLFYLSIHVSYVLGHAFVAEVEVGGHTYPGWNPFIDPYNLTVPIRIVRKVLSDGFLARDDPDLACHHGGNEGTASLASATDGAQISFSWSTWPQDHRGPVSTYMTLCTGGCAKFAANNAQWFKIDAVGYNPSTRKWASELISGDNEHKWTSTIPAGLAAGEYLVRNEIIALHSAGNPQFYPSCSQIELTGSGTNVPSQSDMVSMRNLYKGITFPNIDVGDSSSFVMPGPPVVNFGGKGGSGGGLGGGVGGTSSTPPVKTTSTTVFPTGGTSSKTPPVKTSSTTVFPTSSFPVLAGEPSTQCQLGSKLSRRRTV